MLTFGISLLWTALTWVRRLPVGKLSLLLDVVLIVLIAILLICLLLLQIIRLLLHVRLRILLQLNNLNLLLCTSRTVVWLCAISLVIDWHCCRVWCSGGTTHVRQGSLIIHLGSWIKGNSAETLIAGPLSWQRC
jgi:hypothetical protein